MLYFLEKLKKKFKKKNQMRLVNKAYQDVNYPFLLSLFGKNNNIEMEILRQYQLKDNMIKSPNGFAIFIITGLNKVYQDNIEKIYFFEDLKKIDVNYGKYLYLCENDIDRFQRIIRDIKMNVFETEEGDEYSFSIKIFPKR